MTDETTSEAELPLETAGTRLRRAREASGLELKQLADSTKIPERHLKALEAGEYATLPARTYATGFARSYARQLGLDEAEIIAAVRDELAAVDPEPQRRTVQTFEPGDPSRLPSSALVWVAGLLALAATIAAVFLLRGGDAAGQLPSLLPSETAAAPAAAASAPAPAATGAVVFTALAPDIWVKFYDAAGTQLLQKQLAQGETYAVPPAPAEVLLWTARPEALAITVGGTAVPKLSEVQRTMKDVPVTAAALLARGTAAAAIPPSSAPAPTGTAARAPERRERVRSARQSETRTPAREAAPAPPIDAIPQLAPAPAAAATPAPAAT